MHATLPRMRDSDFPAIRRKRLETLQVNLGYKCNQSCRALSRERGDPRALSR
jgi:hypothetical protein